MSDSESVLKKYPWTLISTTIFIACALVMAIYEQFKPDEVKADQVVEEESSDLPALVINRETGDFAKLFSKLSTKRIIDMSHSFDETTIYWPTDKPFRWEKNRWGPNANGYWYASANYAASEHGGTHLDSPIHFAEGGNTTDQIDLERGDAGIVHRPPGGLGRKMARELAFLRDPALADPGPLHDPLVRGFNDGLEVGVAENPLRDIAPGANDRNRAVRPG